MIPVWLPWIVGGVILLVALLFLAGALFVSSINDPTNYDDQGRENWRY